jgi:hypothetical protein
MSMDLDNIEVVKFIDFDTDDELEIYNFTNK